MQQFNGNASNITPPGTLTILGSTNTAPIQMAFTTPHGLSSGDTLSVYDHQANTAANGEWPIVVINATTVSLTGSTGIAGGSTTGSANPRSFGSTYGQPSDGDDNTGAILDTPTGALGDRSAALLVATGAYKLVDVQTLNASHLGGGTLGTNIGTSSPSVGGVFQLAPFGGAVSLGIVFESVRFGDVIEIDVDTTASGGTSAKRYALGIMWANVVPGGSIASPTLMTGSGKSWMQRTGGDMTALHVKGCATIATTGRAALGLGAATEILAGDTITFWDDQTIVAKLYRPTKWKQ